MLLVKAAGDRLISVRPGLTAVEVGVKFIRWYKASSSSVGVAMVTLLALFNVGDTMVTMDGLFRLRVSELVLFLRMGAGLLGKGGGFLAE